MKKTFFLLLISVKLISQNTTNNLINGVFILSQSKYYTPINCNYNQLKTENSVAAYFTYTPTLYISTNQFEKAGNVKFNNAPLDYDNIKKYYNKTEILDISQQNWKVSGHSVIPNMNFLYNGTLPNFIINENLINDTLKKSDTLFIHINSILNADSIYISIDDDQQLSLSHHVALKAPNYSNTYYLPPSIFTTLVNGPRSVITIEAINYNYQTISGKLYLFRNIFSYVRANVKIIN